jgi:methionyl-tRNA formyltransferase
MRIAFAGTPAFAVVALQALHDAGHEVVLVLTQPDRPAGRGLKLQASPVKQRALSLGLPVAQPRGLRLDGRFGDEAAAARAQLLAAAPQVMVVAAYGLILPPWALALPALGCINIHGSLLPRWRGAAPIHRAIEAGDVHTGITIMQMDAGLDTGDMWLAAREPIRPDDTTGTLHDRLAALGAKLVVQVLGALGDARAPGGGLHRQAQPEQGVSYAHKVDKAEAALDWRQPAAQLERRLRAFDPFPGCHAQLDVQGTRQELKVWRGRVVAAQGPPGERLPSAPEQWLIACGQDALELLEVQPPGARRVRVADYLRRLAASG